MWFYMLFIGNSKVDICLYLCVYIRGQRSHINFMRNLWLSSTAEWIEKIVFPSLRYQLGSPLIQDTQSLSIISSPAISTANLFVRPPKINLARLWVTSLAFCYAKANLCLMRDNYFKRGNYWSWPLLGSQWARKKKA